MIKLKILIIEDNSFWQESYWHQLEDKITILQAFTEEEAREIFRQNPDIALIVMDGCLQAQKNCLDTLDLTEEIRKSFAGPMIAASGDQHFRCLLQDAGCNHQASKKLLPYKIKELLKL